MKSMRHLGRDLRRMVEGAARDRTRTNEVRASMPTNVVIARNIRGAGSTHSATARQTVVVRDANVVERTETVTTSRSVADEE